MKKEELSTHERAKQLIKKHRKTYNQIPVTGNGKTWGCLRYTKDIIDCAEREWWKCDFYLTLIRDKVSKPKPKKRRGIGIF
jgi:hypothetical protein